MFNINTKQIPTIPGVYFFCDKRGRILYIGKAVNLKNRLISYFKPQLGGWTAKLMEKAARVSWQETDSEIEALILESQLIKKHKPPFNIVLRDDKQYFYVIFTTEEYPRIFLSHQPFKFGRYQIQNAKIKIQNDNVKFKKLNSLATRNQKLATSYIGPFTDGLALKTTLRFLRRIFPYCTCKQKHNNFCLNYHIGKCLGFCCLKQQNPNFQFPISNFQKEYRKNTKAIKDILSGRQASLIKKFKKEMANLGKAGKFEEAIGLRDKIMKLEKVFENAQIIQNTRYEILDTKSNRNLSDLLNEFRSVLNLPNLPHRIEGYDISNIQGQFATGAMVVFTNGQPDKNQYRRFKIRNSGPVFGYRKTSGLAITQNQKPNDIAMLKEVLTRRFNHPEWPWPDLIVVDGGKAQLNATRSVISNFQFPISKQIQNSKFQIPIIALTKNENHRGSHIYLESSQDHRLKEGVIPLKKLPERVRNLILQVDVEAHRFAIGYYRKLHKTKTIS